MADTRKPEFTFLLRKKGKKKAEKIELFDSELWDDGLRWRFPTRARRYRLRINGRWNDKIDPRHKKYFTSWQFRDILWRSIKL